MQITPDDDYKIVYARTFVCKGRDKAWKYKRRVEKFGYSTELDLWWTTKDLWRVTVFAVVKNGVLYTP